MTAGNYQVRERLIDMVGAVSARLGRLLELSPELEDRDRLLVNRLASDIAALQSGVLEAVYTNRVTSPHSLRELHDLETGALVTLDRLETYISASLRQRAAAYAYPQTGMPRGWDGGRVPPAQPFAAGAWGQPEPRPEAPGFALGHAGAPHPAWPGTDARYIDVPYEPVAQPAHDPQPSSPTPLVPQDLAGPEFEVYGDALRRAVSSFNLHDGPRAAAPPPQSFAYHEAEPRYQPAARPEPPQGRAMVPVAISRAGAEDIDDVHEPARGGRFKALIPISAALLKGRAGMALVALAAFVVGAWGFASGERGSKSPPVVMAKVSNRMEPLPSANAQAPSPKGGPQEAALPGAALEGAAARNLPLTPGRPRDVFVPVIATMATRDGIEQKVEDLKTRYPDLVDASAKTGIEPVIGADGRQWYRTFLLPGRSQTAIRDFCRGIREAGYMQCWAKRLARPSS